jgi:hypothetical protein
LDSLPDPAPDHLDFPQLQEWRSVLNSECIYNRLYQSIPRIENEFCYLSTNLHHLCHQGLGMGTWK